MMKSISRSFLTRFVSRSLSRVSNMSSIPKRGLTVPIQVDKLKVTAPMTVGTNQNINSQVDLGTSFTSLPASIARAEGLRFKPRWFGRSIIADGTLHVYPFCPIKLSIGNVELDAMVKVHDDHELLCHHSKELCPLIGLDVLLQADRIDLKQKSIEFQDKPSLTDPEFIEIRDYLNKTAVNDEKWMDYDEMNLFLKQIVQDSEENESVSWTKKSTSRVGESSPLGLLSKDLGVGMSMCDVSFAKKVKALKFLGEGISL